MAWTTKLDRAKQHFDELHRELTAFYTAQPYSVGTRRDPQTAKLIYYLSDVTAIPITVACICGDVIQNLRSSLDHLAYDLWANESNGRGTASNIYFPIGR